MSFKQAILGTFVGRAATQIRDTAELVRLAVTTPEGVGTLLNDQLATRLVTGLRCRTFVDVGAHIGSVIAQAQYRTGAKVIAIEAMPDKAVALTRKFPGVKVHACAVGNATGDVSFFVTPAATGYSSLIRSPNAVEIVVPLRRLDDLIEERVDIVKIDVEGAELGVLQGAERTVRESRPVIMFESSFEEKLYSKDAMFSWLNDRNYHILAPDRMAHDGPAFSREGFAEAHWYPRRCTNYFAVPAERRTEVRELARQTLGRPCQVARLGTQS